MGRKGVNLLEGDDEERKGDSEGDSRDDDGGSYERSRGGFVDVLMVILFVCVMLGGVAWAGYQFWWLPKVKKETRLERARMKQEQQKRMSSANIQGATERAQRAPGQFSQTASASAQQKAMSATDRNTWSKRPAPSRSTEIPASPAAPMTKRIPATPGPAGNAPSAAVARMEKPAPPPPPRTEKKPLAASATIQKPVSPPNVEANPRRDATPAAQSPKKADPGKRLVEKKPKKPAPRVRSGAAARKSPRGFYYSVQVASCSTERCADSFSRRLRGKGFSAFRVASASRAKRRSAQITEVRLGSFSSLAEARVLMNRARKSKIEARVYRSDNQWRVVAGSFRNLEDAALLLDRAEDSGFRGALASGLQSRGTRKLYRIRTGKFETLREALALRKKIRQGGFSDAIVVRRRSGK